MIAPQRPDIGCAGRRPQPARRSRGWPTSGLARSRPAKAPSPAVVCRRRNRRRQRAKGRGVNENPRAPLGGPVAPARRSRHGALPGRPRKGRRPGRGAAGRPTISMERSRQPEPCIWDGPALPRRCKRPPVVCGCGARQCEAPPIDATKQRRSHARPVHSSWSPTASMYRDRSQSARFSTTSGEIRRPRSQGSTGLFPEIGSRRGPDRERRAAARPRSRPSCCRAGARQPTGPNSEGG